jgi:arylsulfatase A-like enzyme
VPNIVFIMADDLGWASTSDSRTNMGSPSSFFQTPTIASLASQGMAFTHAYTNGPACTTTRAALLTGHYASRPDNNIFSFNVGLNMGNPFSFLVGVAQGLPGSELAQIPASAFTLAEMLKSAGYSTAHFGKYHVGDTASANAPLNQGFDFNFGGGASGGPGQYHADLSGMFASLIGPELDAFGAPYTQQYVDDNVKPYSSGLTAAEIDVLVGTEKNITDAMVDAAISFMDANNSQPFYCQFHQYAVHVPIDDAQARQDLLSKYQALPPVDDDGDGFEIPSYAALIEDFDQSIARIVAYLQATADPRNPGHDLAENTLVIFYSDNGGKQVQAYHGPLRGGKGEFEEGGIRVPMVVWSANPNLVEAGAINSTPVISIDFFATFAELSGADTSGLLMDGKSLAPILSDASALLPRNTLFWHFPGYHSPGELDQPPRSIVRREPWKLSYFYEDQSFRLYNLDIDISESNDVAALNPDIVAELSIELLQWLDQTDAPLATLRSGPLNLTVSGLIYSNGQISRVDNQVVPLFTDDEMPFVLDNILSCEQIEGLGYPGACPGPVVLPGLGRPGLLVLALLLGHDLWRRTRNEIRAKTGG